jgi:mono/diheme cytochrome c family protein
MRFGLLAACIAMMTGPAVAQDADAVSKGRALALQLCSGCHFVEAGQRVPMAVGAPPFPQLANDPAITEFHLRNFLRTPHPVMPMLILTPEEADSVVAFILALKSK